MAIPSVPGSALPLGEDAIPRAIKDLTRQATEDRAAVAESFGPVIARLDARQAELEAIVDSLAAVVAAQAEALKSVVAPASFYVSEVAFSTGPAYATKAQAVLAVPSGFTKAVVSSNAFIRATNPNANGGYMWVRAVVNSTAGPADLAAGITTSVAGIATGALDTLVTGLTDGSTLTVMAQAFSSESWAASAGNQAVVNGTVVWFR